jgi:hypothetical protein
MALLSQPPLMPSKQSPTSALAALLSSATSLLHILTTSAGGTQLVRHLILIQLRQVNQTGQKQIAVEISLTRNDSMNYHLLNQAMVYSAASG